MSDSAEIWDLLRESNTRLSGRSIRSLVDGEADRVSRCSGEVAGLYVDFNRHRLDATAHAHLLDLAAACGLTAARDAMARNEPVNVSEGRGARHMAMRSEEATRTLAEFDRLVGPMRAGDWRGARGQAIDRLINIGIGGSDLGPRLVVDALAEREQPVRVDFLANIDGESITEVLADLDPGRTGFCVTSKSFGTEETLTNALTARDWLRAGLGTDAVGGHFLAVTARSDRAEEFGVDPDRILPVSDEVGGRFSLWSSVGLPIAAALGIDAFAALLEGGRAMDRHFLEAPPAENLPINLALLSVWYRSVVGCGSHAFVPYDRRLRLLPAYLQQLDMESCGKGVDRHGNRLTTSSGAVIWGGEGTKGQHAFFQWLHQSPDTVPVDLMGVRRHRHGLPHHHRKLMANLLGQATALMDGRDLESTRQALAAEGLSPDEIDARAPHCVFPGNRPSTILLLDELNPASLGALLALHEHRVFCQAWIWGINPFDQWGVELGKQLAGTFERLLEGDDSETLDPATQALLDRLR